MLKIYFDWNCITHSKDNMVTNSKNYMMTYSVKGRYKC